MALSDVRPESSHHASEATCPAVDFETIIVGAGISGIGTAIALDRERMGSYVILEQGSDLGGTWRDNTYPGIAVDIPSISYCFSFEIDYPWSHTYAPGAEIQAYLHHCSEKYGIGDRIRYEVQVVRIVFDSTSHTWVVTLADGEVLRSRFVIAATGILSQPIRPSISGLESFEGKMMHTAEWDHDVDLHSKRVGIIGTGASAAQVVPSIAAEVSRLEVYQRTPIWIGPRMDRAHDPDDDGWRSLTATRRAARWLSDTLLQIGTWAVVGYARHPWLVRRGQAAQEKYMRRSVDDPALREKLIPEYGLGCKRPAFSNDYLQAFNRNNVDLLTEPIQRITPKGIQTRDGVEHPLDVIILGTGFKTQERGNAPSFEVVGPELGELGEFWENHRYQAFNGVSVAGFPNFFLTAGPFSGGFNWYSMLEANLEWILRCMKACRSRGATRVEVKREAQDRYVRRMRERSERAIYKADSCVGSNSYYIDRHGDASLPYPRTPLWRWLRVRLSSLRSYRFDSLPQPRGDRS